MFKKSLLPITTLALVMLAAPSSAQTLVPTATAEFGSGIEGGGRGPAEGIRRARTLLRVGAEAYVDEFPKDVFSAALQVEVEPYTSAGADLRYIRKLSEHFALHIGPTAFFVPATLWGMQAGFTVRIPISDSVGFTVGPNVPVYFLGHDLPDESVIFQAMVNAGFRADL